MSNSYLSLALSWDRKFLKIPCPDRMYKVKECSLEMHIDRASCCLKNYQKHNLIKKFFKSIHFFLENLETKGLKSNCLRSVYIKLPGISKVSLGGMNIS